MLASCLANKYETGIPLLSHLSARKQSILLKMLNYSFKKLVRNKHLWSLDRMKILVLFITHRPNFKSKTASLVHSVVLNKQTNKQKLISLHKLIIFIIFFQQDHIYAKETSLSPLNRLSTLWKFTGTVDKNTKWFHLKMKVNWYVLTELIFWKQFSFLIPECELFSGGAHNLWD